MHKRSHALALLVHNDSWMTPQRHNILSIGHAFHCNALHFEVVELNTLHTLANIWPLFCYLKLWLRLALISHSSHWHTLRLQGILSLTSDLWCWLQNLFSVGRVALLRFCLLQPTEHPCWNLTIKSKILLKSFASSVCLSLKTYIQCSLRSFT